MRAQDQSQRWMEYSPVVPSRERGTKISGPQLALAKQEEAAMKLLTAEAECLSYSDILFLMFRQTTIRVAIGKRVS